MPNTALRNLLIGGAIIGLIIFLAVQSSAPQHGQLEPYSVFTEQLNKNLLKEVTVNDLALHVKAKSGNSYTTLVAAPLSTQELSAIGKHVASVEVLPRSRNWGGTVAAFFPILLLIGFLWYLSRSMRGNNDGAMQFGKSRARIFTEENSQIRFADVAGVEEAKNDLYEVVEFLRTPSKFHALGARIPHGVLMVGPPGSGKTHLAKAVAGEANVPFFSISGSDFVEMFVGVGAARVRDLFETAVKASPCIIFIDEIDAVGRKRGSNINGGNDEREQTLNALLVEMDGFESKNDVIIIAATNRPDVLDPALLRPGRFDRQVVVDAPDIKGREAILRIHAKGKPLSPAVNLETIARRTPGFVGADLENLLNEAALIAARENHPELLPSDIDEAADRVVMGPARKSRVISPREKRITAYHEGGHALAAYLLPYADPVHKITIVPRGRAGGYVMRVPEEDRMYMSKKMLLDTIAVALAGRVAEELIFDDVTTGAQNDFQQATDIAKRMMTSWGMSEKLGRVSLSSQSESFMGDVEGFRTYSEKTARTVDNEIRSLIDAQYARVTQLLEQERRTLDYIVDVLLERETLTGDEFKAILERRPLPQEPAAPSPSPQPARQAAPTSAPEKPSERPSASPLPPGMMPKPG